MTAAKLRVTPPTSGLKLITYPTTSLVVSLRSPPCSPPPFGLVLLYSQPCSQGQCIHLSALILMPKQRTTESDKLLLDQGLNLQHTSILALCRPSDLTHQSQVVLVLSLGYPLGQGTRLNALTFRELTDSWIIKQDTSPCLLFAELWIPWSLPSLTIARSMHSSLSLAHQSVLCFTHRSSHKIILWLSALLTSHHLVSQTFCLASFSTTNSRHSSLLSALLTSQVVDYLRPSFWSSLDLESLI